MSLPLPSALSPSKVSTFTECALAFRFSAIDRLPEPASPWTAKGTLVHRALERLHSEVPAGRRTPDVAAALVRSSVDAVLADPECEGLDVGDLAGFVEDAERLARNAFLLEDPNQVTAVGIELKLEAQVPGGPVLRGVIDRLDRRPDGTFVVVDYKTGTAPRLAHEKRRLAGVQVYAFLVESVFGVRPAAVELLHLREPVAISAVPADHSIRQLHRRTVAIWDAIVRACERDDFRPNRSALCSFCAFRDRCPAWAEAPAHAPAV